MVCSRAAAAQRQVEAEQERIEQARLAEEAKVAAAEADAARAAAAAAAPGGDAVAEAPDGESEGGAGAAEAAGGAGGGDTPPDGAGSATTPTGARRPAAAREDEPAWKGVVSRGAAFQKKLGRESKYRSPRFVFLDLECGVVMWCKGSKKVVSGAKFLPLSLYRNVVRGPTRAEAEHQTGDVRRDARCRSARCRSRKS